MRNDDIPRDIDLTIDGDDKIYPDLRLIKALLECGIRAVMR
jgi:ribose 5-phosphate isomerase